MNSILNTYWFCQKWHKCIDNRCHIWQNGAGVSSRTFRSKEFKDWYNNLTTKDQRIVDSRIDIFRNMNELISAKQLDRKLSLYEYKWVSGMRVYFSLLKDSKGNFMLLLLGGNKNTQPQDIAKAKAMILRTVIIINKKGIKNEKT